MSDPAEPTVEDPDQVATIDVLGAEARDERDRAMSPAERAELLARVTRDSEGDGAAAKVGGTSCSSWWAAAAWGWCGGRGRSGCAVRRAGSRPAEARRLATAALAWYRGVPGDEAAVTALERIAAAPGAD